MTVTVNTVSAEGFRHSVHIDDHELFADVPASSGVKAPRRSRMTISMQPWAPARP